MQTAALQQTPYNPSMRPLLPMDGGLSIAQGIPAFDSQEAMRAYAGAGILVTTVSPAPEAAPAPFEPPRFDVDLDDLDLAPPMDDNTPSYAPAPRRGA